MQMSSCLEKVSQLAQTENALFPSSSIVNNSFHPGVVTKASCQSWDPALLYLSTQNALNLRASRPVIHTPPELNASDPALSNFESWVCRIKKVIYMNGCQEFVVYDV